jgi:hypothetical protein
MVSVLVKWRVRRACWICVGIRTASQMTPAAAKRLKPRGDPAGAGYATPVVRKDKAGHRYQRGTRCGEGEVGDRYQPLGVGDHAWGSGLIADRLPDSRNDQVAHEEDNAENVQGDPGPVTHWFLSLLGGVGLDGSVRGGLFARDSSLCETDGWCGGSSWTEFVAWIRRRPQL